MYMICEGSSTSAPYGTKYVCLGVKCEFFVFVFIVGIVNDNILIMNDVT